MEQAEARGLWALGHPAEIRGGGVPFGDHVYLNEIIGRSEAAVVALGTHTLQDSLMLQRSASPEQQDRWLRPLVEGDILPAVGLTESEAADPTPPSCARRRCSRTATGSSTVTSGSRPRGRAAFVTVFAKTDPEAPPHQQFSAILVPTDTPGFTLERVIPTMGFEDGIHAEMRLDGVRVPASAPLGERGHGFRIAQLRLGPGRIFHCMGWVDQVQRAFDLMRDYANQRFAHRSLLSEKGEIQRYVAARLMTLDAARRLDEGDEARVPISAIKFYGARMLHDVIGARSRCTEPQACLETCLLTRCTAQPAMPAFTTALTRCIACRLHVRSCATTSTPCPGGPAPRGVDTRGGCAYGQAHGLRSPLTLRRGHRLSRFRASWRTHGLRTQ